MQRAAVALLAAACACALLQRASGCNEAVCASVVSKCMLTASCKCDLVECSCCKECFACLDYLYSECCSCVDMCPQRNKTDNELSRKSYVEEFGDGVPGLFSALTAEPDQKLRWLPITFPVDFDVSLFAPTKQKEIYHLQSVEKEPMPSNDKIITLNCTVAYVSQCMSFDKCRASCQSMGSSSMRWFHDGCCECIGDKCINYGIDESRCLACPNEKDSDLKLNNNDDDLLNYDEDSLDYGEGEEALQAV